MNRVYIHYGADHFDKNLFNMPKGGYYGIKNPTGGLWGSPVDSNWTWKDWCEGERYHLERLKKSFRFTLANGSKVFHIRTANDIEKLPIAKYPEGSFCIGWYYDWDKIISKYDAVELHLSNDYALFHDLFYSWDVDSIVVLNPDVIREME